MGNRKLVILLKAQLAIETQILFCIPAHSKARRRLVANLDVGVEFSRYDVISNFAFFNNHANIDFFIFVQRLIKNFRT